MTTKIMLWFTCRVCHTDFLSYCLGHYLKCFYFDTHTDGTCFFDNRIGEIHNNHVLNTVKDKRKCRKCDKANQLEEFI